MSYDRMDWHYGGDFPAGLPSEAGGTHIGMFLAWAITRGLEGEFHRTESVGAIEAVRNRAMTGREFLIDQCDEKFWEQDLNDEGNAFAKMYYAGEGEGSYLNDYEAVLGGNLPSLYHVEDSWENFDALAPVIDRRFATWRRSLM
jgi:hypothetical protein